MPEDDLALAAKVHYAFLPERYRDARVDIAVKVRPYSQLGGDYCGIHPLEDKLVVTMCDVVGHGMASALLATRVNDFAMSHAVDRGGPCQLIAALNEYLYRHVADTGLYTSFFAAFLDFEGREVAYAGAGHPALLHYRSDAGNCERLESSTTILGFEHPLPVPCASSRRALRRGDKLVLYTDGLMEFKTHGGSRFGQQRLEAFVRQHHHLDSTAFNDRLFDTADCHTCQVRDDILIMTVSVK